MTKEQHELFNDFQRAAVAYGACFERARDNLNPHAHKEAFTAHEALLEARRVFENSFTSDKIPS